MIERSIKKAVVTGSTGCIGVALCKELLSRNIEVFAVVRPNSERICNIPTGANIIKCDIAKLDELQKLIVSCDAFFHLAWTDTIGPGRNDMTSQISNIKYSIDAVKVASALNCKVFVGAGSQAECGRIEGLIRSDTICNPENGYGIAKLCASQMTRIECEKHGIDHIWMRVLSVYGPYDSPNTMIISTIKKLLKGEKPSLTAGEQKWDYLYCDDAAHGFYLGAAHGVNGKIYPLGSGKTLLLKEYVEILRNAINPNLQLGFGDIPYSKNQVMNLQADISELTRDAEFEPEYLFREGIKETINWVKNNV